MSAVGACPAPRRPLPFLLPSAPATHQPQAKKVRFRTFNVILTGPTEEERAKKFATYKQEVEWLIGNDQAADDGICINLLFGFKNARSLTALQKALPNGTTVEVTTEPKAVIKKIENASGTIYRMGNVPKFDRRKIDELNNLLQESLDLGTYNDAMTPKLDAYFSNKFAPPDTGLYKLEDFNIPPFKLPANKTTIFVGETRIGKTQFALAHFTHPILVSGDQDWCKLREGYTDGIVLDDMPFRTWTPEKITHTLDCETPYSQNVKYSTVRVPPGLPKIVCINSMSLFWPKSIHETSRRAIKARIVVHEFKEPLFGGIPAKKRRLDVNDDGASTSGATNNRFWASSSSSSSSSSSTFDA
ncbi:uncharacterized protein [Temnothorax longispinosus]|uniref:uncharacterized protein n=1 Tax=Temnothorax longispinosus TaxID=300112 RepID=UPI003A99F94F